MTRNQWGKIVGNTVGTMTGVYLGIKNGDKCVLVASSFIGSMMVVKGLSCFFWDTHWPTVSQALAQEFKTGQTEFWILIGIFVVHWIVSFFVQLSKCMGEAQEEEEQDPEKD